MRAFPVLSACTLAWVTTVSVLPISARSGANRYTQTNLSCDISGVARNRDGHLFNPWGIDWVPGGPINVVKEGDGVATQYDARGHGLAQVVTIPSPPSGLSVAPEGEPPPPPPSRGTGIVANRTHAFSGDRLIVVTQKGVVAGWQSGSNAVVRVNNSGGGAVYTGVAPGRSGGHDYLYAADFHNGRIDVFDGTYAPAMLAGSFADTQSEPGYAPFNIANLGGKLYVSYARRATSGSQLDDPGPGRGYVNVFKSDGTFERRLATGADVTGGHVSALNSPWGMAWAPSGFGKFGGHLLVGNFGSGQIAAFRTNGAFAGVLGDAKSQPLAIPGLWGLKFGDGRTVSKNALYFVAGLLNQQHGLLGMLQPLR